MNVITQKGEKIDVRATELNDKTIRCACPKKNKGVILGEYKNPDTALHVLNEIQEAACSGLEEYKMPGV